MPALDRGGVARVGLRFLLPGDEVEDRLRALVRVARHAGTLHAVSVGLLSSGVDEAFRDLPCKRIEADEIWSFVYAKEKNVPEDKRGVFGFGDVWTFTAIDPDTKLIPTFLVGPRDIETARAFMEDVASRLSRRVQLTTDGHRM